MKLLALDPSSSAIGYSVFSADGHLLDAGRITPLRTRDEANERIRHMTAQVLELLKELGSDVEVVMEDTSGKVGRRHGGAGAGLAVHGKAVGYAWGSLVTYRPHLVAENEWTRGVPKRQRQRAIAAVFPTYDAAKDPGGDVSHAIGLGLYWLARRKAGVAA